MIKKKLTFIIIVFASILCLCFFCISVHAQDNEHNNEQNTNQVNEPENAGEHPEKTKPGDEKSENEESTIKTLKTLIQAEKDLEKQLSDIKRKYRRIRNPEEKAVIEDEMGKINTGLVELGKNFEKVATGGRVEGFDEKPKEEFEWKDEIDNLVSPFIQEIKKITARPRKIERIRSEIAFYEKQIDFVRMALKNMDELLKQADKQDRQLNEKMTSLKNIWLDKEKQLVNQLEVSNYELDEIYRQKQSLWKSAHTIFKVFFKTRGKNLIYALLAFCFVFLLLRVIYQVVYRFSPFHKRTRRSFGIRLFDVLYYIFTLTGSVFALFIALYITGDWLLLSFSVIFLLGITWTAKKGLPRYWKQIQIMLNLGAVRENERLIYNGIPWKIIRLNIYVRLENPCLNPAFLRVPLNDVMELCSRPYNEDEPWFPSNMGDWVVLKDGTHGQVLSQTADMVQIGLRGGADKTYLTQDFLELVPMNLSKGFRLKVVFGFDYKHQARITRNIPQKLENYIRSGFVNKGLVKKLLKIVAGVADAGASSLDIILLADFSGEAGAEYVMMQRVIKELTIDACTENRWSIPFTQITIHNSDN